MVLRIEGYERVNIFTSERGPGCGDEQRLRKQNTRGIQNCMRRVH